MTKASDILIEIKKLQNLCNDNNFKINDARGDFFKLIFDVFDNFYKGNIAIELAVFINQGKVRFSSDLHGYQENLNRFVEIIKSPVLSKSFLNNLNRRVIVDVWSAFEVTMTSIAETVFTQIEKNDLLSKDYDEVLKILKEYNITEKVKSKLNVKLTKKHLSHVSINQKYEKLFKKIKTNYKRDIHHDRTFLDFWGKLRNTMHGNYIYTGNYFEYEFQGYHFIFENEKVVLHTDFEDSPYFVTSLINEIILIFSEIINHLKEFDFIQYLDPEAEEI